MESVSREGVSMVTLRFAWGTDMDFAALNVREKLDGLRGQLPERAAAGGAAHGPAQRAGHGDQRRRRRRPVGLKELTESVFKRRLEQIDGVAQAAVTGGLEREIHVDVDAARLESYGSRSTRSRRAGARQRQRAQRHDPARPLPLRAAHAGRAADGGPDRRRGDRAAGRRPAATGRTGRCCCATSRRRPTASASASPSPATTAARRWGC
jgi:hypothetical protein